MRRLVHCILLFVVFAALFNVNTGCATSDTNDVADTCRMPDTLRVTTLYGPLSFFLFREDTLGYDFSLIKDFTAAKGIELDVTIATSIDNAIALLDSGTVDVIVYGVPVTSEYLKKVVPCGPEFSTSQVLVQQIIPGQPVIRDVTQLVGKDVYVQSNSKYQQRLENLNSELGGGINIMTIPSDTITDEDIIEMVATGRTPLSVVDGDIALLNKTYYRNIDVGMAISFGQRSRWGVTEKNAWLGDSITDWFESEGARRENEILLKRYFQLSKNGPEFNLFTSLTKGKVSPYDDIFRKHAERIGWDWRLLAAQGFVESQFNNDLVSWAGACGVMQVMPSTARAYHVNPETLTDPETCIALAADVLKTTEDIMARYIDDSEKRRIFAVAAYNSGVAHIIDAITLAKKYGKDPDVWFDNVENALLMKSDPRYFNDPDVKYGYFRGRQTTQYVRHVTDFYNRIKKHVKQ